MRKTAFLPLIIILLKACSSFAQESSITALGEICTLENYEKELLINDKNALNKFLINDFIFNILIVKGPLLENKDNSKSFIITVQKYAFFLNALAKEKDTYELYDSSMKQQLRRGNSYYAADEFIITAKEANEPMLHLSNVKVMRFCNWVNNGCLIEKKDDYKALKSTENGAYFLHNSKLVSINPEAKYYCIKQGENENGDPIFAIIALSEECLNLEMAPLNDNELLTMPLMMLEAEESSEKKLLDTKKEERGRSVSTSRETSTFSSPAISSRTTMSSEESETSSQQSPLFLEMAPLEDVIKTNIKKTLQAYVALETSEEREKAEEELFKSRGASSPDFKDMISTLVKEANNSYIDADKVDTQARVLKNSEETLNKKRDAYVAARNKWATAEVHYKKIIQKIINKPNSDLNKTNIVKELEEKQGEATAYITYWEANLILINTPQELKKGINLLEEAIRKAHKALMPANVEDWENEKNLLLTLSSTPPAKSFLSNFIQSSPLQIISSSPLSIFSNSSSSPSGSFLSRMSSPSTKKREDDNSPNITNGIYTGEHSSQRRQSVTTLLSSFLTAKDIQDTSSARSSLSRPSEKRGSDSCNEDSLDVDTSCEMFGKLDD